MVRNKGTIVPPVEFANAVSLALRKELGTSARATKTIMRWTGASDRAAKYWLAGSRCPSGNQLVMLARHSDAVLQAFLGLAGRDVFALSIQLNAVQAALGRASALVSALRARDEEA